MADTHTKEQRSRNMSRIRSKDTVPEKIVGSFLFKKGLRYRKNVSSLPGKPDLVFPKYRTVVFVNGCFWHQHDCGRFRWPSSNEEYWKSKIQKNTTRDKQNYELLKSMGWRVLVIWECQLKKKVREQSLEELYKEIIKSSEMKIM